MEIVPWLTERIRDFVRNRPDKSLRNKSGEKAWQDPLVGFAAGTDPLFVRTRERFGFESYGCGLCQAGVPCESCIPVSP